MYCKKCGSQNDDNAFKCIKCGEVLQQVSAVGVAPGKINNYLAQSILVTLFCCLPFGIPAIVYSAQVNGKIQGGDIQGAIQASNKAKMWGWISFGVGILILLSYLPAIAIPSFMKARTQSQANACINNLRQIEVGKEQWALATKQDSGTMADVAGVNEYIRNPQSVTQCPAGGTINYGVIGVNATCTVPGHKLAD
jgi:Interferon-induced transmembrane protein